MGKIDKENELYDNYCKFLFSKKTVHNNERGRMFFDDFEEYFGRKGYPLRVPYDEITSYVFKIDSDKLDIIFEEINQALDVFRSNKPVYIERNNFIEKTISHIKLAIVQKKYIDSDLIKARANVKEINKTKSQIYTDFITILGIFTAITFATFGGLQLLGNVYGNANTDSLKSIGGILFLGSSYIFGVYLILIVLLTGIKKLTNVDDEYKPSKSIFKLLLCSCLLMSVSGIIIYIFGYFLNS